ncbi:MAG: KR domain-containing protein, partial [Anaerolineae bacterium]|nr:KR domain-containing protein [Anaerolineae bacterium]
LWLVTRGAQPAGDDLSLLSPAQAPLWGLGRTVAQEEPAIWGGLIDLFPAGSAEQSAEQLLGEILQPDGENQIAFRNGLRFVARLDRWPKQLEVAPPPQWRKDAAYLITGGLGGLGLELARWLVDKGARRLILMGRTALPPRVEWG